MRDIGDLRFELEPIDPRTTIAASGVASQMSFAARAAAVGLSLVVGVLGGVLMAGRLRPSPRPARVVRTDLALTGTAALSFGGYGRDFEIASDGSRLVYVGDRERRVFVRELDRFESVSLFSQSSPQQPTISPDGQSIGFLAPAFTWRRMSLTGVMKPSVTLQVAGFRGVVWDSDGSVIAGTHGGDLVRITEGGNTSILAKVNEANGEIGFFWPFLLPGRSTVLVTVVTSATADQYLVAAVDLATGARKTLLRGTHPQYIKTGHLLFANEGAVWAVPFDAARVQIAGTPVRVIDDVATTPYGAAEITVSNEGTLVYTRGGAIGSRSLAWVDREGREERLKAPLRPYIYPRISPDGSTAVVVVRDAARDLWIWDFARETLRRLTQTPDLEDFPVWAPGGDFVIHFSCRTGRCRVLSRSANGLGDVKELPMQLPPMSRSLDGQQILGGGIGFGLSLVTLADKSSDTREILKAENPVNPQISSDGRWLTYQSRQSGQNEVYVRPFPNVDSERWQVSLHGGTRPVWSRNMREIFYLSPAGAMMTSAVQTSPRFMASTPTRLFQVPQRIGGASEPFRMFDVSPDGRRFLIIKDGELESTPEPRLVVIQNWFEELKRLVPTTR